MNNLFRSFAAAIAVAAIGPTSFAAEPDAPLLFCIGVHVEPMGAQPSALVGEDAGRMPPQPGPDYNRGPFFLRHVADLQSLAAIVEKHGGKMTVQAQTPFTSVCVKTGDRILADFEKRGHEIALHFHEGAHLGRNGGSLPVETWTAVMKEEIELIKKAGATRVRYWSGGNLYPKVLDAAAAAGLDVMSDHKNPRVQRTFPELLSIHPWRPAGGPTAEDITAFAKHDPTGRIVYLPDGIFTRTDFNSMRRSEFAGSEAKYFDFLADSLRASLNAARADRVNVFHITVHAGEFRDGPEAEKPFGVIDRWLTDAVDPLVKAGKVKWATLSEMADAFHAWEKKNPGVEPRAMASTPPPTFFAVHCEAHSANPPMWDALCRFVAMADRYSAKLTLMFNPQWAEFICPDKERFQRVKAWQKNGHEVAVHYHNVVHGDWNGHTNRHDERYTRDRRYRGTVAPMMESLQKLAVPDTMLTMCMGPDARWDSLREIEIDELDYPDGILYDVDGMDVGLTPLMKTKFKGRDLFHLKHHFFAPDRRAEHLDKIKEEFRRAKPGEVLGVVTHEQDFARSLEFIERWFQFCRENKAEIKTVRDIVRSYPPDKVVEVPCVRQEIGSLRKPEGIFAKVRKFHESLRVAKEKGVDTSAAEALDRQSREAAGRGDMAEAERLLDKATEALGQKKTGDADNRACITFAVNTHDWPHLDESAATVLRLVGIFEKNKVRGDFYFTPQIVEHYEQKRPDVIQRLKQSGMCISYHVRPPHPTYGGFEQRLRDLDDAALAKTLRDYETYQLDPATGELQRDKAGGYSYVAQVFGRRPVVVSPQCRDPRIRAAALKVYADLGAKMVVACHEIGTKLEQPFEWAQGLLARPSDFSITRWAVGGRQEMFWWNMLDTPDAAGFNPTARLKSQLAAWKGPRAPFITVLIHENDFSRSNGTGWGGIYFAGEGRNARPKQPPFDLNAPDLSRPRLAEVRERIWSAYEALVAYAAANLRAVTSEEIVALAGR
ncbi:MAG: hypothetical protein HZC54_24410 [Verrucomicrobia bacterium]|nr:hypothetical protein [Verrucomicrobiota bacterium]